MGLITGVHASSTVQMLPSSQGKPVARGTWTHWPVAGSQVLREQVGSLAVLHWTTLPGCTTHLVLTQMSRPLQALLSSGQSASLAQPVHAGSALTVPPWHRPLRQASFSVQKTPSSQGAPLPS